MSYRFIDNRNEYGEVVINVAALPTAPRAEQAGCYDESKVPDRPPFTAYVGNLPYDVEEEDLEKYFNDSKVSIDLYICICIYVY